MNKKINVEESLFDLLTPSVVVCIIDVSDTSLRSTLPANPKVVLLESSDIYFKFQVRIESMNSKAIFESQLDRVTN